ncbi:Friend virus susceptibility protein 1-like [Syngnathoides biaculeatus]|uniref:Friend virus susceptibility protein 1-like n=1 Tax=Syngnathoides biaculeatus TaxID=300417 RepID=UPI002ADD8FDC|nr:Friend virus susceptibility protein 1-like [Syngnathoides biaculeatus]
MRCFRRKTKSAQEAPEEEVAPGWEGITFREIEAVLRERGGRPGSWTGVNPAATPLALCDMLKRVDVNARGPLGGTQQMLWMCAEAWKNCVLELDKVRSAENQKAQEVIQLEVIVKELKEHLAKMQSITERAVMHISRVARRGRKKKPRKIEQAQIRSFTTGLSAQWNPEEWNGDMWGDDDDDNDLDDEYDRGARPDPPPQTGLYPSLKGLPIHPITRQKEQRRVIPDRIQDLMGADGRPILDENGERVQGLVPQAQPEPELFMTREDYTQEETTHIVTKYRQKPGEPIDVWLIRLLEEGADAVIIDAGDYQRFAALSTDSQLNAEFQGMCRVMGGDVGLPLSALYGAATQLIFPSYQDWPELRGQWSTIRDAVMRLTRLCMRHSISSDGSVEIRDGEVPKMIRDAIIRDAPPHYRAAVLTILLGAADLTFSMVKSRLAELATLGDWSNVSAPRDREPREKSRENRNGFAKNGKPEGSRSDMWRALIKAGVPAEEIDRVPTSALAEKCRQKGLQVRCFSGGGFPQMTMGVAELTSMLKELIKRLPIVPPTIPPIAPPTAPPLPREEEETSSSEEEEVSQVAAVQRRKKGKKGKNKRRHHSDE